MARRVARGAAIPGRWRRSAPKGTPSADTDAVDGSVSVPPQPRRGPGSSVRPGAGAAAGPASRTTSMSLAVAGPAPGPPSLRDMARRAATVLLQGLQPHRHGVTAPVPIDITTTTPVLHTARSSMLHLSPRRLMPLCQCQQYQLSIRTIGSRTGTVSLSDSRPGTRVDPVCRAWEQSAAA